MKDPNELSLKTRMRSVRKILTLAEKGWWLACGDTDDRGLIERWGLPYDVAPDFRLLPHPPGRVSVEGRIVPATEQCKWIPLWAVVAVNPDLDALRNNPFSHVFCSLTENKSAVLGYQQRLDYYNTQPRQQFILLTDFKMKHEEMMKRNPVLAVAWNSAYKVIEQQYEQ